MSSEANLPRPPQGISRWLYRAPILLYRLRLGWLLGNRALLLEHTGRVSGRLRRTVLEVIRADPRQHIYVVVSGFGTQSDWYRNLLAQPAVQVIVGTSRIPVDAATLSQEQAQVELRLYEDHHPGMLRFLAERLLGLKVEEGEEGLQKLMGLFPVVRFERRV